MSEHITRHALIEQVFRAADIVDAKTVDVFGAVRELRLAAFALDRVNMNRCNGIERYNPTYRRVMAEWTEADETRAERITEKNRARFNAAMRRAFGPDWEQWFKVEFQGDPRGAPCKVYSTKDESRLLFVVY